MAKKAKVQPTFRHGLVEVDYTPIDHARRPTTFGVVVPVDIGTSRVGYTVNMGGGFPSHATAPLPPPPLNPLTPTEVMALIGCSDGTLRKFRDLAGVKPFKVGRGINRYTPEQVARILAAGAKNAGDDRHKANCERHLPKWKPAIKPKRARRKTL